ncbi:hypothetical protein AAIH05_37625, partial [Pseudomonas aeruginosa]
WHPRIPVTEDKASQDLANQKYLNELGIWYATYLQQMIREKLVAERRAMAAPYYAQMSEWGWMAGGTFVLRAANDFGRAQSYAEGATAMLVPTGSLAAL